MSNNQIACHAQISSDAALHFLREFRAARAKVQADAEAYKAVWDVVESLDNYEKANLQLGVCGVVESLKKVNASYRRLSRARNALVHEGAVSRNMGMHAVCLSLAMEEALMGTLKNQSVEHWMVPDPVVAQRWQTVIQIRRALLSGGYSVLPFWWKEKGKEESHWYFIRDVSVARYVRCCVEKSNQKQRDCLMNLELTAACEKNRVLKPCRVPHHFIIKPNTPLEKLFDLLKNFDRDDANGLPFPFLVVHCEDPSRLLGILTAHDLLI